ncbi:hypothetical protein CR165_13235 [Pseudoroseomonas aestuarii]|uniref:Flagellar hook-length control protein-like C-terminal domain-containing protein n=2 Tax=Teichococcus aestuarii TaxID=568898 RepID=A0A2U1V396_9PROT|nr:hypothetical protein CR165_13235 [Pseudoroseomonas aestuarii]
MAGMAASAAEDGAAALPSSDAAGAAPMAAAPETPHAAPSGPAPGPASAPLPAPLPVASPAAAPPVHAPPVHAAPPPVRQVEQGLLALATRPATATAPARIVVALQPEALGRIEITLEKGVDTPASLHFAAERPETLLQLMQDAPAIQAVLQQAGLAAEQGATLQFGLWNGAPRQEDGSPGEGEGPPHAMARRRRGAGPASALLAAAAGAPRAGGSGQIDLAL